MLVSHYDGGRRRASDTLPAKPGSIDNIACCARVFFNFSYGVGTPGGIFFPVVAFGTVSGLWFAQIERLLPAIELDHGKCAVAGLAATVLAPLTGLMLVFEMTGNYQLVVMSLLASIIADANAEFLEAVLSMSSCSIVPRQSEVTRR
jgi:H+/Cl- antiporter ClcA